MPNIQPEAFDLIVLGTGLQESLIAAAASLAGLSVLHLDPESEYGSHWAGHSLERFTAWLENLQQPSALAPLEGEPEEASTFSEVEISGSTRVYSDAEVVTREVTDSGDARQILIDLAPKVLYASGPLVDALLRCSATSYLVFRLVPSCIWKDAKIAGVPSSRADIFKEQSLSPAEKRMMMRFLKSTLEALEEKGPLKDAFNDQPFLALLQNQGLPEHLQDVIAYSLAQIDRSQRIPDWAEQDSVPTGEGFGKEGEGFGEGGEGFSSGQPARQDRAESGSHADSSGRCTAAEALQSLRSYVDAVSKYGGAFMLPDYGAGEVPQAFCRVAAVRGAVYVLRCSVRSILVDKESRQCRGVKTADGQILTCQALAAHPDLLPKEFVSDADTTEIARAVAVLDRPLLRDRKGEEGNKSTTSQSAQMLLTVPPGSAAPGLPQNPVRVLQLGQHSLVAPRSRFILHMSSAESRTEDLKQVLSILLGPGDEAPKAVMTACYSQKTGFTAVEGGLPSNVAICQPPDESAGYHMALAGAKAGFLRLFPELQFLPELPDASDPYDSD